MAMVLRTISDIFTAGNKKEEAKQKDGHITSILLGTSVSAIAFACFEEESYFHPKWLFSTSQYTNTLLIMLGLLLVYILVPMDFAVLRCQVPCLKLSLSSPERPSVLRGLYSVWTFWIWNYDSSFPNRHHRNWML